MCAARIIRYAEVKGENALFKTEGHEHISRWILSISNIDYESNPGSCLMVRTNRNCKPGLTAPREDTQVRYQGGVKSPVLAEPKKKKMKQQSSKK